MPACSMSRARRSTMFMGCYGIGVTRVVAAAIEQNHDANGIVWPEAIAPFKWCWCRSITRSRRSVQETADALYAQFIAAGIDVLLDDRDARPGVKFADSELIGIPHRIVIGERGLAHGKSRISSPQRDRIDGNLRPRIR